MSKYSLNELIVHSENEEMLKEFVERAKDHEGNNDLSFEKLLRGMDELPLIHCGHQDWHELGGIHWRTKIGIVVTCFDYLGDYAVYQFRSELCPPAICIAQVALMFPDLHFLLKYDDIDGCFMGVLTAKGDRLQSKEIQYDKIRIDYKRCLSENQGKNQII